MKITFEFDTDKETFDQTELQRVKQADDVCWALEKIMSQVRSWYKYDQRESIPSEEIKDTLNNILQECHVDLDILWR